MAELNIAAAIQVELSRFAAAQTKPQESPGGQIADGADDPHRLVSLGIDIFQLDDQIVGRLHG